MEVPRATTEARMQTGFRHRRRDVAAHSDGKRTGTSSIIGSMIDRIVLRITSGEMLK